MKNVQKIRKLTVALFLAFLLSSMFISLSNISMVKASGGSWLSGWSYRKSHIINPSSGAGANYQVRIKVLYTTEEKSPIPYGQVVSTLPMTSGTSIMSAQSAVYWDGTYLHVWYGSQTSQGSSNTDNIYYTKASSPFTSWGTPVKVIDRADGIRDPTIFVEGDYIYLFCQCYDGTTYRPIRLYKIPKTADFTNSANYVYVGVVIDLGSSGQFDDYRVASPCVVKIGDTYYLIYEACDGAEPNGVYSIGRAKTTNIESLPWTKDGQLRNTSGNVIYNPTGNTNPIVPCTFADTETLFIHYRVGASEYWSVRYISGDVPNNSMTLSGSDINPSDGYINHAAIAHIGYIDGIYHYLMQSWDTTVYLRLYRYSSSGDMVLLNEHCRTDFGDVRFTRSDGVTLLDYWIEEKVDGDYAVFWVEVADDLSANPATIYIYYGNPNVATTSNGEATFLFFDDFPGTSYDTNKWQQVGSPKISVSDSSLIISRSSYSGSWSFHGLRSKTFQVDEGKLLARLKKTMSYGDGIIGEVAINYWSKGRRNSWTDDKWDEPHIQHRLACDGRDVGGGVSETVLQAMSMNTWYNIRLMRWGTSYLRGWVDGAYKGQVTSNVQDGSTYVAIGMNEWLSHTEENIVIDWIAIAKYVDPEPSHGGWGSEEKGEYVIIDQAFVSDERADIGSTQTVAFHAKWGINSSDITQGNIYINGTLYVTNSTGWVSLTTVSSSIGRQEWAVTAVNCGGVTDYTQTVSNPGIIWDRIKVISLTSSDDRIDVGSPATLTIQLIYEYDNTPVSSGSFTLNGLLLTYQNGVWMTSDIKNFVSAFTYDEVEGADEDYGITIINMNEQSATVIWDRVAITLSISDDRINIGATAGVLYTGIYEFDSTPFIGTITLNDTITKNTVGKYGYKVSSIFDPVYGLTAFTTNEVYCIFDRINIIKFEALDDRINVEDTASFRVEGVYEYDSTPWAGSYELNDTVTKTTVGKYWYKIVQITDSNYGLTVFQQTAPDAYVIFDRINVVSYGSDDAQRDVNTEATFYLTLEYEYDGTPVTDGIAYLNGSLPLTWSNANSRWEYKTTRDAVQKLTVYLAEVSGNAYGITALNPSLSGKTITVIWDQIKITDGGVTKETLTLDETVIVWFRAIYEYDGTPFTGNDGTLYLNGTQMTWSPTNIRWEYKYTADAVGTVTFKISAVLDNSQNLTTINDAVGAKIITVWSMPFSILSNSIITELYFNSSSKIITFKISGQDGTTGYINITIAKTLIEDINGLTIYFDETPINYTATPTNHFWLIHFTYNHSTHRVVITLGSTNAETSIKTPPETATKSNWIVITILTAGLLISITARKKLARTKRNSRCLTTSRYAS